MSTTRHPKVKAATLTVRLDLRVKTGAVAVAEREPRSLTRLVVILIVNHCRTLQFAPEHFAEETHQ